MINNELIKEIIKNGGSTLTKNLKHAELNNGYMVSLEGAESKVKSNDYKAIIQAIKEKQEIARDNSDLYIGLWVDNDMMYIDISININDKVEALEFGKKNKQLAIYDLENDKSLYLKDYKFSKYYTIYKVVKDENNNIIDYKVITQEDSIKELANYFESSIKTIKNSIYSTLKDNYKQLVNDCIIIKDYELNL